ncbi:MAG: hypothetical protein ACYST6_06105, partial [Planctomycetota bacterium]
SAIAAAGPTVRAQGSWTANTTHASAAAIAPRAISAHAAMEAAEAAGLVVPEAEVQEADEDKVMAHLSTVKTNN